MLIGNSQLIRRSTGRDEALFWHLMHPVQDRPDNCTHKEQFRYKPTSPDGLADHHAVAAQLQYTAKVRRMHSPSGGIRSILPRNTLTRAGCLPAMNWLDLLGYATLARLQQSLQVHEHPAVGQLQLKYFLYIVSLGARCWAIHLGKLPWTLKWWRRCGSGPWLKYSLVS